MSLNPFQLYRVTNQSFNDRLWHLAVITTDLKLLMSYSYWAPSHTEAKGTFFGSVLPLGNKDALFDVIVK